MQKLMKVSLAVLLVATTQIDATVLFSDGFESGLSPEWVSKEPSQWIENGWLHQKDVDGWPRDALIITHDSDPNWINYHISMVADFVEGSLSGYDPGKTWNNFTLVFRSDNFSRSSDGGTGRGYQLMFNGNSPDTNWQEGIRLQRNDYDTGSVAVLYEQPWSFGVDPMAIDLSVNGNEINFTLDGTQVFDIIDPDPLPYGGVGFHTIWESESRMDSITVVSTPASLWILVAPLGWLARKRS